MKLNQRAVWESNSLSIPPDRTGQFPMTFQLDNVTSEIFFDTSNWNVFCFICEIKKLFIVNGRQNILV